MNDPVNAAESFRVVIPARFASSRFPGKALALIDGRPMIEHVYLLARASGALQVLIATDDRRVADVAKSFGADVIMTRADHESGTDRIAEAAALQGWAADDVVVNLQGDAPCMPASSITAVARLLRAHPSAEVSTLCTAIDDDEDYLDPNVVKVVADQAGRALYFSRSPIPAAGHGRAGERPQAWRHLGIYAYRVAALRRLTAEPPCYLETCERLEQLRALWLGMEIRVGIARDTHGPDVDTPEDLARAQAHIARRAHSDGR